jgi:hypothetical protein
MPRCKLLLDPSLFFSRRREWARIGCPNGVFSPPMAGARPFSLTNLDLELNLMTCASPLLPSLFSQPSTDTEICYHVSPTKRIVFAHSFRTTLDPGQFRRIIYLEPCSLAHPELVLSRCSA